MPLFYQKSCDTICVLQFHSHPKVLKIQTIFFQWKSRTQKGFHFCLCKKILHRNVLNACQNWLWNVSHTALTMSWHNFVLFSVFKDLLGPLIWVQTRIHDNRSCLSFQMLDFPFVKRYHTTCTTFTSLSRCIHILYSILTCMLDLILPKFVKSSWHVLY